MPKFQLTGRTAGLVGLGAALSTAALVTFAAPAFAADSNRSTSCTDKVNVRSEPSKTASIVGSCSAGEKVTTDETRNGFSHLESKNGWVSNDYIKDADSADDNDRNGDDDRDRGDRHRDRDSGGGLLGGGGL